MQKEPVTLGKDKKSLFKDKVMELLPNGGNLNACFTCGACSSGCPSVGIDGMDPRKFLRMAALGMDDEILKSNWAWFCTMCQRCMYVCPMQIDIPQLIYHVRKNWPRENRPKGIRGSCDMALKHDTCSSMGVSIDDWKFVVEDLADEIRQKDKGFEELQAPIDKGGAYFFLNQNSKEPVLEPNEMAPLWKILHLAGADWTYASKGWAAENYCMFLGDDENWEKIVRIKAKAVDDLGCKVWVNTECGHELYAFRVGLKKFNIPHKFEIKSIIHLYARWIREGKLKVSSEWNKNLKIRFTVQDPCQIIRKSYGDPLAMDLRFVIKSVVGEENFIDMYPNKSNNYCCGGGSGFLQAGFPDSRRKAGKIKFDQIIATGADYCITPCHNCHSQITDLCENFRGHYNTVYLWTLICLSMGVLGQNERAYLGQDLITVGLS